MAKYVELRRHTDNDGDYLTDDGVRSALEVGARLNDDYAVFVSSGAQRSTQTIACLVAASGLRARRGVVVDDRFRSEYEDRWKDAYNRAGAGDIEAFRQADPDLVDKEAGLFVRALEDVFRGLPDGGRAMVVGHSPMQEAAVWGLTGHVIPPLGKGEAVLVILESDGTYRIQDAD